MILVSLVFFVRIVYFVIFMVDLDFCLLMNRIIIFIIWLRIDKIIVILCFVL